MAPAPPDLAEIKRLHDAVTPLVREAGRQILRHYADSPVRVARKADDSPLTAADLAAHEILFEGLTRLDASTPVISEESDFSHGLRESDRRLRWLVDPLDGTKEFLAHNGEFTVNVALVYAGRPLLGIVLAPAQRALWSGIVGTGAWRTEESEGGPLPARPIHVRPYDAARPLRVVASRTHRDADTSGFLEAIEKSGTGIETVAVGSSLKFCLVADGRADLYARLAPTMAWDTAAAHAVVEAAGGHVQTLDGQPLHYPQTTLRNPSFVATGDPAVPWPRAQQAPRNP